MYFFGSTRNKWRITATFNIDISFIETSARLIAKRESDIIWTFLLHDKVYRQKCWINVHVLITFCKRERNIFQYRYMYIFSNRAKIHIEEKQMFVHLIAIQHSVSCILSYSILLFSNAPDVWYLSLLLYLTFDCKPGNSRPVGCRHIYPNKIAQPLHVQPVWGCMAPFESLVLILRCFDIVYIYVALIEIRYNNMLVHSSSETAQ